MLLSKLHETITKRAKTVEELQKILDLSTSTNVKAVSAHEVEIIDGSLPTKLSGFNTPGTLPFKVIAKTVVTELELNVSSLSSLKGLENLNVDKFIINMQKPSLLTSLQGCPSVSSKLTISNCSKLKSLEHIKLETGYTLILSDLKSLESIKHAVGVEVINVGSGCGNVTFKNFPVGVNNLIISEFGFLKTGIPWIVMIPKTVDLALAYTTLDHHETDFPRELYNKIIKMQSEGGTRANMLEIQQDLLDAGFDEMAKM